MVSNSEFLDEVHAAFSFIAADASPKVIDQPQCSTSFGNNLTSLEGDVLRVRVTLDRGEYLVDLSPLAPDWFDLDVVLQCVANASDVSPNATLPLRQQSERLQQHYDAVTRAFQIDAWQRTRAQLAALQEARGRTYFLDRES